MVSQGNFLLPPCRRRRAEVARGRLVAIGLALGAMVTGVALILTLLFPALTVK